MIGPAGEFDDSGTQAVRALKPAGYRIILVNSNPATIMPDPELADSTSIRSSSVLGGRVMEIVYQEADLRH